MNKPIVFRAGLLPRDPSKPRLRLSSHLNRVSIPVAVDYYSHIPSIGMLGNDIWGDCVFAGDGHIVEQQTAIGQGQEQVVTTGQVLDAYSAVTGFNPNAGPSGDNPTDNGALIQDGLNYLQKKGIAGHKIAMFGELDLQDHNEIKQAVYEFGALSIGVQLPQSAMDQYNAGQPWTVSGDPTILGGHCVIVVGYDSEYVYVLTWGIIQKATWAWWDRYVSEAWAIVSRDWVSVASLKDPEGVDIYTLGKEYASLTGLSNPFPEPSPGPSPGPSPTPVPDPSPTGILAWLESLLGLNCG